MTKNVPRLRCGDPPPPVLAPHEKPNPEEMAKIARELLRERATDDADLAAQIRRRGIVLTPRALR
jgi:hypothetical protein